MEIDSEKYYVCFTNEAVSYEDGPTSHNGMYITGILYINGQYRYTEYGLHNDTRSERNIKCVYSRIFHDISEIKNNKLS